MGGIGAYVRVNGLGEAETVALGAYVRVNRRQEAEMGGIGAHVRVIGGRRRKR
jgi:hypothetical protein